MRTSSISTKKSSDISSSTPTYTVTEEFPPGKTDSDSDRTEIEEETTEDNLDTTTDYSVVSSETPDDAKDEEGESPSTKPSESTLQTNQPNDNDLVAQICANLPEDQFQAPHPFDCTKFLFCDHGHVIVMTCPDGLWYDPFQRQCEYPEHALCLAQP